MVFCKKFFIFQGFAFLNIFFLFLNQLHRIAMITTWCLTIISFAVIFVDLDGWAQFYPHEIFGIIATILCFIQPIIAMFRPNVSSPKRKYFNLTHIFCGSITYGLASMFCIKSFNCFISGSENAMKAFAKLYLIFCNYRNVNRFLR